MPYNDELKFESDIVKYLISDCGWNENVIKRPTEEDLIENWKRILFENNRERDVLNNCPLTDGEMDQILAEVRRLRTPLNLNNFINGKTIQIKRDNHDDNLHFGQYVSLKIYDRNEIAGGKSRYQIVEQPRFKTNNSIYPSRRGDLMLLINGMPVFHIELKRSGVDLRQAEMQIKKYMSNNVFTGIFSLVQIFVIMNPEEAKYFANPGRVDKFNERFYFNWANFNNVAINNWGAFCKEFLSIPRAHEMIGFYTIPDKTDATLKVMRSYQVYAAERISRVVKQTSWTKDNQCGGYIWHTTGSGKTMTSFKTAQLITEAGDADKVVFLLDRVELGKQTLKEYINFSTSNQTVNATNDTNDLINKLKSDDSSETLIVTSIQKMSRIKKDEVPEITLNKIKSKHIVFIVDECHRDQAGEMHQTIKYTFPTAIFFGFTGTPDLTLTKDIFGNELHRYSIVNGIKDKNVLAFDPSIINTFKVDEIREKVALYMCGARNPEEAMNTKELKEIYNKYINRQKVSDVEIEAILKDSNKGKIYSPAKDDYKPTSHMITLTNEIKNAWINKSVNHEFSALLATSSIKEAILYYRLFKNSTDLKITAIFDQTDNNEASSLFKMEGITEILEDYNNKFNKPFTQNSYQDFKDDVCERLAHKENYVDIEEKDKLDLVIVVDQLLTGFDSKWINTLYLDKVLEGGYLIQAISRTNRLCNDDKSFGTIVWSRYPYTMKENLDKAISDYSGDVEFGIFVNKLDKNISGMNEEYEKIKDLFDEKKINNFVCLDKDTIWQKMFAKSFVKLSQYLKSAKIQGFNWEESEYRILKEDNTVIYVKCDIDIETYCILLKRYQEIRTSGGGNIDEFFYYDLKSNASEANVNLIDEDFVNNRFNLYLKDLTCGNKIEKEKALTHIHDSFASLSASQQEWAKMFLNDIESGSVNLEPSKNFSEYLYDYEVRERDKLLKVIAERYGLDVNLLEELKIRSYVDSFDLNTNGKYQKLKDTADINKIVAYYSKKTNSSISKKDAYIKFDEDLRNYIFMN